METLVAGSYDRFLFGFECSTSGTEDSALKRTFTHAAHKGPVRCVASATPYLASGGADDLLHLYDLQAGSDLGFLMSPGDGAVSAVAFHAQDSHRPPSHMFSGAADGSISVWQAGGDWVCLKTLKGHKKEVSSISLHPSGRLALSTSRDSSLRLWNLVKGKCAHNSVLTTSAEQVAFSPSGNVYGLVLGSEVTLHDIGSDGPPKLSLDHLKRAQCLAFAGDNALLTGSEDGAVRLWDPRVGSQPVAVISKAHKSRVRAISPLSSSLLDTAEELPGLVASASSDGTVRLWDFRRLPASNAPAAKPITEVSTGARLTCLTSVNKATSPSVKPPLREAGAAKPSHAAISLETDKTAKKPKKNGKTQRKVPADTVQQRVVAAGEGVAHNGVVDFTYEEPGGAAKKKSKKQRQKAAVAKGGVKKRASVESGGDMLPRKPGIGVKLGERKQRKQV